MMRHVRALGFDALETRQLLSKAHHVAAHIAPALAAVPLVLDGTLTVNNKGASVTTNGDGSSTTSTPVAGVLAGLGQVRGIWNESVDSFGQYQGPDTILLHDPQGTFVIAFNTAKLGKARRTAQGDVFHQLAQHVYDGTGAYARASESGTLEMNTNTAGKVIVSMTLNTPTR
jgi:hypothetical protein